jgi:hypothetical protein
MKQNRLLIQFNLKRNVTMGESPAIGVGISSNNDTNDISAPILEAGIHPKRQKQALIHNYGKFGLTNNNEVPEILKIYQLPCSNQKGVNIVQVFVYWYKSFDSSLVDTFNKAATDNMHKMGHLIACMHIFLTNSKEPVTIHPKPTLNGAEGSVELIKWISDLNTMANEIESRIKSFILGIKGDELPKIRSLTWRAFVDYMDKLNGLKEAVPRLTQLGYSIPTNVIDHNNDNKWRKSIVIDPNNMNKFKYI